MAGVLLRFLSKCKRMLLAQSKGEALPLSPADAFTLAEISEQVSLLGWANAQLGVSGAQRV